MTLATDPDAWARAVVAGQADPAEVAAWVADGLSRWLERGGDLAAHLGLPGDLLARWRESECRYWLVQAAGELPGKKCARADELARRVAEIRAGGIWAAAAQDPERVLRQLSPVTRAVVRALLTGHPIPRSGRWLRPYVQAAMDARARPLVHEYAATSTTTEHHP